jgi:glutamyl-tRNA reductase
MKNENDVECFPLYQVDSIIDITIKAKQITMEKKQSAIEWFYKNLKNYKSLDLNDKLIQDLYKQALQMEQEQIKKASGDFWLD